MSDLSDPEVAVRSYLLFLEDPSKLFDPATQANLEAAVARASEPIERLKAISELKESRMRDRGTYEDAFIRCAKAWAAHNNVPASSFQEIGVSDDVLRAAGLLRPGRGRRTLRSVSGVDVRAASVSKVVIKSYAAKWSGTFTQSDLAERAGGSPMTLRKAIHELITEGILENRGPSTTHLGPGRAPITYAVRESASPPATTRSSLKD
ncbi:MAG: hypothetical protein JWM34_1084 [Ilumatobacteraceae bacterium]|nr:hypothetical protein [Ilumatobacteraceae bacterium]